MNIAGMVCLAGLYVVTITGCGGEVDDGPPKIRYGDSICVECGMIISDERFATATIIVGDRGNEPMVFDDFNCQMIFEFKHSELVVVDRWSHDHGTKEWMHMADAWFVRSDQLHTPMASNTASFNSQLSAQEFSGPLDGEVVDFKTLWLSE